MPSFTTTRPVLHKAEEMFTLVADVERYPEFVPMCEALKIRRSLESGDGITNLMAEMSIGYKLIHETFTCRVALDEPKLVIHTEYIDGPFKFLENRWSFKDRSEGGSTIDFYINYEFKSRTFALLAGAVFDTVFRRMAEAFEKRADKIYQNSAKTR